jgi:hypothetical protein
MPAQITAYLVAVWLCVGLITGFGWTVGAWVASRLLR